MAALRGGHLARAALLGLPNLHLTPHCAYYSVQARADVSVQARADVRRTVEQTLAVSRGEQWTGIANPAVFEHDRLRALHDRWVVWDNHLCYA